MTQFGENLRFVTKIAYDTIERAALLVQSITWLRMTSVNVPTKQEV